MIDVVGIALILLLLLAFDFMGRSFAGLQIKKHVSFKRAFSKSAVFVAVLTVLVFIPLAAAGYLSATQFPDAIDQAYGTDTVYLGQLIPGFFTIFSLIAIPFMIGLWVKYRAIPEPATA